MAGSTRRDLLRIGAVLGAAALVMARPWSAFRTPEIAFADMPRMPPLRRLVAEGAASGGLAGGALLAGLDTVFPPGDEATAARLGAVPCAALGLPWAGDGPVPVTYFTDIRCPSCRALEATLSAMTDEDPGAMALRTREFPVFGPRSEAAARVILAAGRQGAAEAMRAYLRVRPVPEDRTGLARLAEGQGLDVADFLRDWDGLAVQAQLVEDRVLARLLGLPGTHGLVVGRTIVVGAQPRATLARLVAIEREEGPPDGCS
jgi:predicted DsbA family dithiol-disulfide isomerase